jgi:Ni/Fe-hydrogenase subunit HybB-like protein
LTWDVIVLNGYLLLNMHICGYLLYMRFRGRIPEARWFKPFVYLSIIWAFSIHTVTAFLYCGLGGRPFWNSAVLGPRFLASAFVAGPAFIILALQVVRHFGYPLGQRPIELLVKVVRITCLINLFLFGCEIFTVIYTGSNHLAALQYLLVGLHGKHALVPWIWTAIAMNVIAAILFLLPNSVNRPRLLNIACVLTFCGIWIEKGMGLIIPGFVPSALHEIVEYSPSLAEWKITAGIWAFGLLVYTVALKVAIPVLTGKVQHDACPTPLPTPPTTAPAIPSESSSPVG